jgi:hypothetical protein
MDKIKDLLSEEIKTGIQNLSSTSPGSKERTAAVDDLVDLYKLRIEETKLALDSEEKRNKRIDEFEARESEERFKAKQLKEQVKDRYFKLGMDAAGIILPLAFYAVWMKRGFKFEETGTFTSTTFRGLFNRFRPTK